MSTTCHCCEELSFDAVFAWAQVVLSWVDGQGRTVRRVVTRKLQTTTVLSAYVRDLDVPVAAALLAKGVVQDAVRSEAAANDELAPVRASIGARLAALTDRFNPLSEEPRAHMFQPHGPVVPGSSALSHCWRWPCPSVQSVVQVPVGETAPIAAPQSSGGNNGVCVFTHACFLLV